MARVNIPPELLAALQRDHVTHFLLLDLLLSTGIIYLATTPFPVTWNNQTYLGAAGIGSIEPVTETSRGAVGLRFTLPLVNAAAIASAMTERIQGREVILRYAVVDDATTPPTLRVDPVVWRGKLDASELDLYGPEPKLTVTAEHDMLAWDRPTGAVASHDEHQRLHPGDTFFRYAAETVDKRIVWPARSFFAQ
jgi:hypothetical protein